jgi:DNA-binding SARP family transcriptional activator
MTDTQLALGYQQETLQPVMISLLGSFRLTFQDTPAPIGSGSKAESLLVSLALAGKRRLRRGHLLERLWPETDPALAGQSLNSLNYRLNTLAKKSSSCSGIVHHDDGYYYLNTSQCVGVDVDYFEKWSAKGKRLLQGGEPKRGVAYCVRALALYRGDLHGDDNIRTIVERERLRVTFLDLLASLADYYYTQGDTTQALTYIHRLLAHDPCREDAHRHAMRCYVRRGTRSQALRQYHICRQILATEFETRPEPATQALFNQIRLDPASV